jgi:hypothetical protein
MVLKVIGNNAIILNCVEVCEFFIVFLCCVEVKSFVISLHFVRNLYLVYNYVMDVFCHYILDYWLHIYVLM